MEAEMKIIGPCTGDFRKKIWRPFMAAIKEYRLLSAGDRICVCVSGGKDSMLLALCMQELARRSPLHPELVFLCMNPGYAPENLIQIQENAARLNIPLQYFDTNVFASVEAMPGNPCYMCAKMRRGYLYRHAQALGCNKIALGHHYDDAIETVLMSMLYSGAIQAMSPRVMSDSVPGMQLIRPLYKVHEADIEAWRDQNGLKFLACACRMTRSAGLSENGASASKRLEMKELVRRLNILNPDAGKNIFRSIHNVNLDSMIGWKHRGETHSFLEDFDED